MMKVTKIIGQYQRVFKKWFASTDCYGNKLIGDWEEPLIIFRFGEVVNDLKIVQGNLETDMPNEVLVDITSLKPKGFQPDKKVVISLAHFIRPCRCVVCKHVWQYECYLNNCKCCMDGCL